MAGTISSCANAKRYRVAELALADKVPLHHDARGRRLPGRRHEPRRPHRRPTCIAQAQCSGQVPLVTAVLGASAGHGALVAPMSDFTVMSRARRRSSPPARRSSTSRSASRSPRRTSAVPAVALASGLIHNVADDDEAALDLVRAYLGYFPSSAWSYPPDVRGRRRRAAPDPRDPRHRAPQRPAGLRHAPRDRRRVRRGLVLRGAARLRARRSSRALARLGGHPVAVVANQPHGAGRLDRRRRRRQGRALHHRSPTRSTCRSCSSPTTRACCRAARRSGTASCAAVPACSPRRRWRPRPSSTSRCARPTASARW